MQKASEEKTPGVINATITPEGIKEISISGYADMENNLLMAEDTLLWMASTGKIFTSLAFMMLVEEKRVTLDTPVSEILPHFKNLYRTENPEEPNAAIVPIKTPLTFRHLLSHTSGLLWEPGFFQNKELTYISLETQSHVYAASIFQAEPGTRYQYSNAGINTVGRAIEVITGQRYEDYMEQKIFKPLNMADTTYHPTNEQLKRIARGYEYSIETASWISHKCTKQMSILPYDSPKRHAECGGGLFSTASDMAKFAQMLAAGGTLNGHHYISEESLHEMCKKQTAPSIEKEYGLGSSVGLLGHGGAWSTALEVNLETKKANLRLVQKAGKWISDLTEEERKIVGNSGTY